MIVNMTKAMCEIAAELRAMAESQDRALRDAATLPDKREYRAKAEAYRTAAHKLEFALNQIAYIEREAIGASH